MNLNMAFFEVFIRLPERLPAILGNSLDKIGRLTPFNHQPRTHNASPSPPSPLEPVSR